MEFIITIDTEGDNQWDYGRELTVENIKFVPRFQDLCEKYNIKPTYLVTSEVCEDIFSKKLFSDFVVRDTAEIGAHLHAWTTPPFLDEDGFRYNDENHGYATEMPEDLLIEKVKSLTSQIEASFGKRPYSFRSGRYGFNENLARILAENSYMIDSSVTPYTSWTIHKGIPDGSGGPDFINKSPFPYKYEFPQSYLLEIPITIIPTKFPLNRYDKLARNYFRNVDRSILLRILRKIFFSEQPLWLRPHRGMDLRLFDELVTESLKMKLPFIVMMFHSSELMPGCSIYRPDQASIEKLYELLEGFFILLNNKKIHSVTLTEAAKNTKL
jgi:hypothetical protein